MVRAEPLPAVLLAEFDAMKERAHPVWIDFSLRHGGHGQHGCEKDSVLAFCTRNLMAMGICFGRGQIILEVAASPLRMLDLHLCLMEFWFGLTQIGHRQVCPLNWSQVQQHKDFSYILVPNQTFLMSNRKGTFSELSVDAVGLISSARQSVWLFTADFGLTVQLGH
jgi:hypothetical protein